MREIKLTAVKLGRAEWAKTGENRATALVMDAAECLRLWPGGTPQAVFARPDGVIYSVPCTLDGGLVRVVLTATEVAEAGEARLEIRWIVGATIAKSATYKGNIVPSLGDAEGTPPEPGQGYLDQITQIGAEVAIDRAATEEAKGVTLAALPGIASQLAENTDNAALWRAKDGNPATIYPVPKSRLYPRIELVATQEGSGDPSPENIRSILPSLAVGQKVQVRRTGKNLNLYPVERAYMNSTGEIVYPASANYAGVRFKIPVLPNTEYIASRLGLTSTNSPSFHYTEFDSSNNFISRNPAASGIFTTSADCRYVGFHYYLAGESITIGNNAAIQLELGSTATPYEPYSGADYDLFTAAQDFYGMPGAPVVVDAEAGEVTVQDAVLVLNGTEYVVVNNTASWTGTKSQFAISVPSILVANTPCMVSHGVNGGWFNMGDFYAGYGSSATIILGGLKSLLGETVASAKAYLAAQYAASTPVTIQYKRATPITIPITPPVIAALERLKRTEARQNVLTVTANDSTVGVQKQTVTYQKSPIHESDEIAAAIAALA